ncbi:MAG: hypothetical protein CMJ58_01310 [Planctomycetaceae bacterium]|nr:hypothetical protein [Planctomycetaceae bacterium]
MSTPMSAESPQIEPVYSRAIDAEVAAIRERRTPPVEAPSAAAFWFAAWLGTAMAGAVYGLPFFVIGAAFGWLIAAAVAGVIVLPVALCVRSLTGAWVHRLAAPALGGLAGLLSALPLFVLPPHRPNALGFLLAPVLTIVCGQVGAHLMTRRLLRLAVAHHGSPVAQAPWQFSLRWLMVLTAWVAVAMLALRAVDLLEERNIETTGLSLAALAATLVAWEGVTRKYATPAAPAVAED